MFNYSQEQLEQRAAMFTATEINQQPETWKKTIEQIEAQADEIRLFVNKITKNEDFDIILTGAGTSEFVGNAIYSYLNASHQYRVKSYGTTDLVATPENYLSKTKPTLLVSFGRSGNSPESVGAVEVANVVCQNVQHLFITCNAEGKLAKMAEQVDNAFALTLTEETHDLSFAMTSSYSNMMLAALLCLNIDQINQIEKAMEQVIVSCNTMLTTGYVDIKEIVESYAFERIVYLGANTLKGIAQESALKMLELTAGKVATMYDTPLGFRHGPKSIINEKTLTVLFLSDDPYTYAYELDLIKEMSPQRKGNRLVVVSATDRPEVKQLVDTYYCLDHATALNSVFLGFAYIVFAQMLALFTSLALGITPDNPCPTGEVNRVVQGVTLYPYTGKRGN
ncbi:MAG: SIS domain-containing protein [Erysipelotrichaceae bacterium]